MPAIYRKLLRELWGMKGQVLAICLVIASGVATFVMSVSTLESLYESREAYYDRYRFGDIFAELKRAPLALQQRIRSISGVASVQSRIQTFVTLDIPDLREPAVGQLISVPDYGRSSLNDLHLRQGRYIEPGHGSEALVSEAFAEAHQMVPGDSVKAIINGRYQELTIVGVVLSPEFIIQLQGGAMLPDDRRFGVFWMSETALAAALDMTGAFNSVVVSTMRGARSEQIIDEIDRLLEPYGGVGAYDRDDQISHRYSSDEIRQLRGMGIIAPAIFLSVAAFLLNIVLTRLIGQQRSEIAVLKAFGYSHSEVGWHYFLFVFLIVGGGSLIGVIAGAWMATGLTEAYTQFYRFPVLQYRFSWAVAGLAFGISMLAGVAGTSFSVWRAVKLPPAEAMRPEAPKSYRQAIAERWGLGRVLSPATRMMLRNVERKWTTSLFSILGIALSVSVLVLGNFMADALNYLMNEEFRVAQRHDLMISFVEPTSSYVLHEVTHLPGVGRAEPFRSVATRMRAGHRHRRVGITGLPPDTQLFQLLDVNRRRLDLPEDGLLMSAKLARILGVRPGGTVTVHILEGERPTRELVVTGLIDDFAGLSAYMRLSSLNRFLREGRTVSGAYLQVDSKYQDDLYTELKQTPQVAAVGVRTAMLRSFEETFAANLLQMKAWNVFFATVIAFGVVYNSVRVTLAERSRELATLRVIGFTRGEISGILLGELAVLTLLAIPLGLFLGWAFAALTCLGLDTEMYRIPLVIESATYGFATAVTLISAMLSGLIVRRRLDRLDLVSVLKTRE